MVEMFLGVTETCFGTKMLTLCKSDMVFVFVLPVLFSFSSLSLSLSLSLSALTLALALALAPLCPALLFSFFHLFLRPFTPHLLRSRPIPPLPVFVSFLGLVLFLFLSPAQWRS